MSDDERPEDFDFQAAAMKMMDQPDKELGFLWQDFLRLIQSQKEGTGDSEAIGRLVLLAFRSLNYAGSLQRELRYRIEALEARTGLVHTEPKFPPSGAKAEVRSLTVDLDELRSRIEGIGR